MHLRSLLSDILNLRVQKRGGALQLQVCMSGAGGGDIVSGSALNSTSMSSSLASVISLVLPMNSSIVSSKNEGCPVLPQPVPGHP